MPKPNLRFTAASALLFIVYIAALRLFDPFSGDQALFLTAAKTLHTGGVLYRDFWDIKQPGIFVFFLVGGLSFGFTQLGSHIADAVWQIAFAVALVAGLKDSFVDRRWAAFAPIAIVGAYLTGSSPWHLLQVEELAGLPLFCTAWFALRACDPGPYRRAFAFGCGFAAIVAVLFKLLFVCIVAAVIATIVACASRTAQRRAALASVPDALLGACVPLLACVVYMLEHHLTHTIVSTFVWLPIAIDTTMRHAPTARLADSAMRFLLYFRGIIFLAFVGAVVSRDISSRTWRRIAIAWAAAAALVIFVQQQSWWQYQFLLLLPPIGIYAAFGVAQLAHRVRSSGWWGAAWLALGGVAAYVAVPLPQAAIETTRRIIAERPYATAAEREAFRADRSVEYARAREDAAYLTGLGSGHEPIYVFGNPLIYVLADRGEAVGTNGWALQLYTPELWDRLDRELRAVRPTDIFVEQTASELLPIRAPVIAAYLAEAYGTARSTADGRWLRLKLR